MPDLVIVKEEKNFIIVRDTELKVVSLTQQGPVGPQGPQGIPGEGTGLASRINFSWGDSSPSILYTLITGKTLLKIEIYITTPFDGTNPFISIGITGFPELLFPKEQINIKETAQYVATPTYKSNTDKIINLYISPDVDTNNGDGFILLYTS